MTILALKAALRLMEDDSTLEKGRRIFAWRLNELPARSYRDLHLCEQVNGSTCTLCDPTIAVRTDGSSRIEWTLMTKGGGKLPKVSLDGTGMVELRAAQNLLQMAESWLLRDAESKAGAKAAEERKAALRAAEVRKMEDQI